MFKTWYSNASGRKPSRLSSPMCLGLNYRRVTTLLPLCVCAGSDSVPADTIKGLSLGSRKHDQDILFWRKYHLFSYSLPKTSEGSIRPVCSGKSVSPEPGSYWDFLTHSVVKNSAYSVVLVFIFIMITRHIWFKNRAVVVAEALLNAPLAEVSDECELLNVGAVKVPVTTSFKRTVPIYFRLDFGWRSWINIKLFKNVLLICDQKF